MADNFTESDSEGVYLGMSLEDFGVRVSTKGAVSENRKPARPEGPTRRGSPVMPRDQLRESIAHLQEEISSGEPLSPEDRTQLESVLGEVSGILASDESEASATDGAFDDLPTLVERFETTHPKLAVVLGRIADALSQLGI